MSSYAVKLHMPKTERALLKCNNLIGLLTSRFTHCLPPSFSSPSLFVLLSLSFIFILSPGAVEHLVYLPLSPTLWPQRRGWPNLVSIDRELQWHGESQSMPRHPGQGSMTKGRPPGKRELWRGGRERKTEQGEAVDRWRGTRDMRRDSITLRQDKCKVKEREAQWNKDRWRWENKWWNRGLYISKNRILNDGLALS